jgi:LDH2 family malate/lactate/ureidoglycolate dehydrogenase
MSQLDVKQRYESDDLYTLGLSLLEKAGMEQRIAKVVAKTLLEGDLLGHDTHGFALLAPYLKELEANSMTKSGDYKVLSSKPAAQMWDGMRLPGPWLVESAMDVMLPIAKELGIASIAIRRSHHIACLAVYLQRAAEAGMLMVIASSDAQSASVAPYGGTQAVFTPNPIAMGFPCTRGNVLIDISASITTNGMSGRKAAAGEVFAENWLMDAQGNPTNDPKVFAQNPPGTILPIGGTSYGHKGYGLALMVEALTGGLAGFGRADPKQGWGATTHITIYDPDAFGGKKDFIRQMDCIADQCLNNPPRPGVAKVRLPGHAGLAAREKQLKEGVGLHPVIKPALEPYCEKFGLSFPKAL